MTLLLEHVNVVVAFKQGQHLHFLLLLDLHLLNLAAAESSCLLHFSDGLFELEIVVEL
jgi:hypothetical protein